MVTKGKYDMVEFIVSKHGVSKAEAKRIVESVEEYILDSVKKGEKVMLAGLGYFQKTARAARQGLNPMTGEKIQIPAKNVAKFAPSASFKRSVN